MSARFVAGDVIGGDFEIIHLLGQGGMGSVYEAKQRSTGARRAIKTMLPELARDDDFRRRFSQEAQLVAKVDSEHVVQVLSAGIDAEHDVPWIAMELLKGEHLAARLARTAPLDYATASELFAQIGHAFAAAHAAGIVHRDLKPENVFVSEARTTTRTHTVKILDFGIAKVVTATLATSTGAMGSPLWMAPEQTVKGGSVTPATDVWAFGLMAFYALTGRFYWHARNGAGGTPMTLLREITLDPLDAASVRSKLLGGATLPPGFDEWFARCVERESALRFRDAAEAVSPLIALLASGDGASGPRRATHAIRMAETPVELERTAALPADASPEDAAPFLPMPQKTGTAFAHTEMPIATPTKRARRLLHVALAVSVAAAAGWAVRHYTDRDAIPVPAVAKREAVAAASVAPPVAPPAERMVSFGGDTFTMGRDAGPDDERPPLAVSVAGFSLDVSEVSAASYLACVDAGRCKPAGTGPECTAADPEKRNHPVNCVTFSDAKAYCGWVDKRLPSESEWERAARGGKDDRRYPWGAEPPAAHLCWRHDDPQEHGTCAIGSFPAGNTPEGLQDMAGNVWEWTTSRYCTYGTSSCSDERRVARGGSWASANPQLVTTTVRNETFETDRGASLGFRCARSL